MRLRTGLLDQTYISYFFVGLEWMVNLLSASLVLAYLAVPVVLAFQRLCHLCQIGTPNSNSAKRKDTYE